MLNSLFITNNSGIYTGGKQTEIYNSIFKSNSYYDLLSNEHNGVIIGNNYIDLSKLSLDDNNITHVNNIFDNVNLGFKDPENGNYKLTSLSDLIDKGTTKGIENLIPTTDLAGNPRIVGKTIDIGPYEYQGNNQSVENTTNTTNEVNIKVGAGWNMINIPTDIENPSNIDALSIWKWNGDYKSWETYSKDPNLKEKLKLYYKLIDTLKSGDGVWVNENNEKVLKFKNSKHTEINWLTLNIGWNLKGTGEDINLTEIPSKVEMVWYWDNPNKKWMVYSNNETLNNTLQSYYSKGTFEKLNKLKANKAYWFFVK